MKRTNLRTLVMSVVGGILTVLFSWQVWKSLGFLKPDFWSFSFGQFISGFFIVLFASLITNQIHHKGR